VRIFAVGRDPWTGLPAEAAERGEHHATGERARDGGPMTDPHPYRPMRIRLTDDRRARMLRGVRRFFAEALDQEIGELAAERILDFFVKELGAPVYNQAIQDARAFLQRNLDDLEGELYEPDEPVSR
jgi:uncharacterized protein (DUF2164 family)